MLLIQNFSESFIEAGCDEVGRGCLAGPVVAAAVIVDKNFKQNLVNDSKTLNFKTHKLKHQIVVLIYGFFYIKRSSMNSNYFLKIHIFF